MFISKTFAFTKIWIKHHHRPSHLSNVIVNHHRLQRVISFASKATAETENVKTSQESIVITPRLTDYSAW